MLVAAALALTAWSQPIESLILEREFAVEVGSALLRLRVTYPQVMTAGCNYAVNVSLEVVDMGDQDYVELRYISVELSGTSIASSQVFRERGRVEGVLAEKTFQLVVVDPSLREVKGGDEERFDLKVVVTLFSESGDGGESSVEYAATLPVYVYSPPVYLAVDLDAPEEVREDESFRVTVRVCNVGNYSVVESGVRIYGPVEVEGADLKLLGGIEPGESREASFIVKAEERGDVILSAEVWALNAAGFNHTESESIVVSVKGVPRLELYANASSGRVKLYGWLSPTRPLTTISIQEERGGEWVTVASVSVDHSGYFEYTVERPGIGLHRYRALWPGDQDYSTVESRVVSVSVDRVASSIILSPSSTIVEEGAQVTLRGSIEPAVSGTIYIFRDCGEGWAPAGYVTPSSGEFEVAVDVEGSVGAVCRFKAVWQGRGEVLGSESNVVEVKVKARRILGEPLVLWGLGAVALLVVVWLVVRLARSRRV
ncbi:MAG: hypothetical protein DRK00_09920 [Thermoprotei archaeon]|nr:MAG: hypothetical protein DRK00_09920 [Thermoprotei archaeon]